MSIEEKFRTRLTELRIQKGVTARDMSLSIGQSAGYINGIENKRILPSMAAFFTICEFLGVTPMVFFDFDNHNPKKSAAVNDKLKGLSDEQLSIVLSMIEQMNK